MSATVVEDKVLSIIVQHYLQTFQGISHSSIDLSEYDRLDIYRALVFLREDGLIKSYLVKSPNDWGDLFYEPTERSLRKHR